MRIPVHNRGPNGIEVGIEPEGDCVQLAPGESLELRDCEHVDGPDTLVIDVNEGLVSIYCLPNEVWKNGQRIR